MATLLSASIFLIGQPHHISLLKSTMSIQGTSNVHDWESKINTVGVSGALETSGTELKSITSLNITIPVKSIKSTKGSIMDEKTWNALKAKKHPTATYRLSKVNSIKKSGTSYIVSTQGNLAVAGKTKHITLTAIAKPLGNGKFRFTGNKKLRMTMFGIDTPHSNVWSYDHRR